MLKKLLFISFLTLSVFSCSDHDINILEVEATIQDARNLVGFENCDWLISFNGKLYKPSYLPPSYEIDGLQIRAKVELLTETASCNGGLELIRIEQIAPAN